MNKIIQILFGLVIVLLLQASSCKKPDDKPKPKDPVTLYNYLGDVKDYCVFKPGTYWVYENDLTKDIDSHWVSTSSVFEVTEKGSEDYSKHITLKQELFDMIVKSNFVDGLGNNCYWQFYTLGTSPDVYPEPGQGFAVICRKVNSNGGTSNDVFGKPYRLACDCFVYQDTVYSKYTVNGVEYDSVRVMHVNRDFVFPESKVPTGGGGNSQYYFAKGIGIIKISNKAFRMLDGIPYNQTWNLIRKKVLQ